MATSNNPLARNSSQEDLFFLNSTFKYVRNMKNLLNIWGEGIPPLPA